MHGNDPLREIERLNWTLTAVSKVNSALVRATTEHELYRAICEAVTFQDIFALAWIGIPQSDPKQSVRVFEAAGRAVGYLDGIVITWDDSPTGNGPTGRAIKSGMPQFNNDMLVNAQFSPWRERARQWQLHSSFCMPIKLHSGAVVAILMVYSEHVGAFGEAEFALLAQLGDDIGYGVDALRTRAAYVEEMQRRQRAEAEAHQHMNEIERLGRITVVESLTTNLSHEINQPLGAILGDAEAAQLLMQNSLPDAKVMSEILADIRSNARRASEIIRNLRALVTRRSGATQELSMNQLIVDTHTLIQWDVNAAQIGVELELDAQLPAIHGNDVQLQQVLLNLIANARDALVSVPDHAGVIVIKTRPDASGSSITVTVSDNGPGIPEDAIASLTKQFFTTKDGGTGMGLWLSSMLVEQHGGTLTFYNQPAGGACFCVELPAAGSV